MHTSIEKVTNGLLTPLMCHTLHGDEPRSSERLWNSSQTSRRIEIHRDLFDTNVINPALIIGRAKISVWKDAFKPKTPVRERVLIRSEPRVRDGTRSMLHFPIKRNEVS
jgi:hypothetical protein